MKQLSEDKTFCAVVYKSDFFWQARFWIKDRLTGEESSLSDIEPFEQKSDARSWVHRQAYWRRYDKIRWIMYGG
jgi:hypothetical protein